MSPGGPSTIEDAIAASSTPLHLDFSCSVTLNQNRSWKCHVVLHWTAAVIKPSVSQPLPSPLAWACQSSPWPWRGRRRRGWRGGWGRWTWWAWLVLGLSSHWGKSRLGTENCYGNSLHTTHLNRCTHWGKLGGVIRHKLILLVRPQWMGNEKHSGGLMLGQLSSKDWI